MNSDKISTLLSDVSIEGDIVEKDKIIVDAKINGDIKSEKVDDVEIFNYNLEDWVPKDYNEYYSWIVDDPFNEVIYSEAIKYLEQPFTENKEITICKKKTKKNSKFGIKTVIRKLLYISQRYLIPPELQKISFVSPYATLKNIIKSLSSINPSHSSIYSSSSSTTEEICGKSGPRSRRESERLLQLGKDSVEEYSFFISYILSEFIVMSSQ